MFDILTHRRCVQCGELKQNSEFRLLRHKCRACEREYTKLYRSKYPEKAKESQRKYKSNNPEKVMEIMRKSHSKYYKENRTTVLQKNREWKASNKALALELTRQWQVKNADRYHEYNKQWKKENADKVCLQGQKRRASKRGSGGTITAKEWRELQNKYDNKCLCCGKTGGKLTLDHVVPLALGGTHTIDNAQPLCSLCNSKKGAKIIDYR
jgi:5-methylcytosine-specific restriction endonuclease McrA